MALVEAVGGQRKFTGTAAGRPGVAGFPRLPTHHARRASPVDMSSRTCGGTIWHKLPPIA